MDDRLIHDVADTTTRQLVGAIRWEREEQMVEAYHAFYEVVRDGLNRYRLLKDRELRRLAKGATEKASGENDPC